MNQIIRLLSVTTIVLNAVVANSQRTITGKVVNATNQLPVGSATIRCQPGGQSVLSDTSGYFKLETSSTSTVILLVSAIGYTNEKRRVAFTDSFAFVAMLPVESQLENVVVTGVTGAAKIKSVPIAISVVSNKDLMHHANANAIDALSRSVPGLQTVTTGPNVSKPSIRGLGYNRVLTLLDGIRQEGQQWADEHGIEADQYNINRAEVVKGPASLAYGSDAMAGVINLLPFVPKEPTYRVKGNALLEYFSNNGMMAASAGLHQYKNAFFWTGRLSFKQARDYRNKIDEMVFNTGFQEYNISGLAGVRKNWGQSYIAVSVYNNLQEIPDGSRDSLSRKFTYQVFESNRDDITNRPIVPASRLKSYSIDPLHQHIQHYRFYHKTEAALAGGTLQSAASFSKNIRREYNHPTQPHQAGLFIVLNTFQYTASWNKPLEKGYQISVGANAMYQINRSKNGTDFPIPDYNMTDAGAFGMLRKEWKNVSLSGGVRFDNRHIGWKDFYTATNAATGFDYPVSGADTSGATLAFAKYGKSFTGITASVGATWQVGPQWFLKANIARGYRSPNITEAGANGLDPGAHIYYIGNRNFAPEFNLQQDVGIFYNDGSLEAGIEIFNNRIDNYIFLQKMLDASGQPVEIVPGNSTYTYWQGAARLYGLDASVKYHPKQIRWLLFQTTISSVTGLNKDAGLLKQYGKEARYMPLISPLRMVTAVQCQTGNVSAVLQKTFIRLESDAYARQRRYYAVQNTETATPGYSLWNVSAGFDVCRKKGGTLASVIINAENIFNTAYQSHLNRLKYFENYSQSASGRYGIYNMGRNISLKTVINF